MNWWAVLFLPILLRALIPVGFMPTVGPDFRVQLAVCDGDGALSAAASMPMSMDMPAGMAGMPTMPGMAMDSDINGAPGASGSPHHHPSHDARGTCPYGSAPALGALPALALLSPFLIQRSPEASPATAQVAYVEVSPRAQSPRGPPV